MKSYKEIHIWDFPPILTFIGLSDCFRSKLFAKAISISGGQQELLDCLNKSSSNYGIERSHDKENLYSFIKGTKIDRGKIKTINIPLWLLIEVSKILSNSDKSNNNVMNEIEQNIKYYTGRGKSKRINNPKLPIYLTPELVSVIFHFLGDGHIGRPSVSSSYRQMNKEGLNNFLLKLNHCFGDFKINEGEFKEGKLIIPKIITEFYKSYFKLPSTNTFESYVPYNIKSLDEEFLIAGLASFIVDEGHIEEVITIYSKNEKLITDIREITIKCGYICNPVKKKYAHSKFDAYRFGVSSESYGKLHSDLEKLSASFPTCTLVQKNEKFKRIIKRKSALHEKGEDGATKSRILASLNLESKTTSEIANALNYSHSSIREHLWKLENDGKIIKNGNRGRRIIWSIK